jgi:hypothetical protein
MSKIKWVNLIPVPEDKYKWGDHTVYIIHAPYGGLYKIGWTARFDVRVRLRELETEENQVRIAVPPYKLIHAIGTSRGRYLERQLHLLFGHRHISQEWYRLTKPDVRWIIDLGIELEYGIPLYTDIIPPLADDGPRWDDENKRWL